MKTAQDQELDLHLDLWARKAGFLFDLIHVSRNFAGARRRDPEAISFLHTASELTDLLVDVATLAPPEQGGLPHGGTTQAEIPNDVILRARAMVMHWERLADQAHEERISETGASLAG